MDGHTHTSRTDLKRNSGGLALAGKVDQSAYHGLVNHHKATMKSHQAPVTIQRIPWPPKLNRSFSAHPAGSGGWDSHPGKCISSGRVGGEASDNHPLFTGHEEWLSTPQIQSVLGKCPGTGGDCRTTADHRQAKICFQTRSDLQRFLSIRAAIFSSAGPELELQCPGSHLKKSSVAIYQVGYEWLDTDTAISSNTRNRNSSST